MRSRSRALVVELLRTLGDALSDGSLSKGDGGGVIQMPVLYKHGSYQELERCLREMRDNGQRREWWHVSSRYCWGSIRRHPVPSRLTRQGRVPVLPLRSELLIQGESLGKLTADGPVLVVAQYYTWDEGVEPKIVDSGLGTLTEMMYGGDTTRLRLPLPFLRRLEGHGVEPHTSYLPNAPLGQAAYGW